MSGGADYAAMIEPVARILWGAPNDRLSTASEIRWGSHGARLVRPDKGTWADNSGEHASINEGGVIDLIRRERGGTAADAFAWLREQRLVEDDKPASGRRAPQADQRAAEGRRQTEPVARRRIVKTYDYTDAAGSVLYQVVRWEPKNFTQRMPAPGEAGVWVWGLTAGEYMRTAAGRDWVRFDQKKWDRYPADTRQRTTLAEGAAHGLYRSVELREAIAEGATIFLPEGEKDVDSLWSIDVPATTNSGGAKHWDGSHAEQLRGADVVILIDNDKAGRERGAKVAASLIGVAKSVRVLDLVTAWADMPEKGDVSDWIASGGTAEKLYNLAADLDDWEPEPFKSAFGMVWFAELDAEQAQETEWLIEDWLTVGDRSMMYGASRSGKSFLAIHAAMCIARGTKFFGHDVRRGGVVYQAGEGAKGVKKRFRAYREHFGVPRDEKVPLALLRSPIDIYRPDGDTTKLIDEIKSIAAQMPVRLELVVIDTLATATAGADENSAKDMGAVLANITRIARECGCHVMLVHHKNANGDRPRGHTSVFANTDNAIEVTFNEVTKVRTVVNTKQKDEEEAKSFQFELMRVVLGAEASGKLKTSCVCLPVGEKEAAQKAKLAEGFKLNDKEAIAYRALMDALARAGQEPPANVEGVPPGIMVAKFGAWRDAYIRLTGDEDEDDAARKESAKKALQRVGATLLRYGLIGRSTPWVWRTFKKVRGFPPLEEKSAAEAMPGADDMSRFDHQSSPPDHEMSPPPDGLSPAGGDLSPPDDDLSPFGE